MSPPVPSEALLASRDDVKDSANTWLPGKTVEHGYPAVQEVAVEVERHLVWSWYEIFDREKSRDWFHPPLILERVWFAVDIKVWIAQC